MSQPPIAPLPQQSLEVIYAERDAQTYLGLLLAPWIEVYGQGGPLPQKSLDQAIALAAGTLMLRLADLGLNDIAQRCPDAPVGKAHGDMAILLGRVAGYLVAQAPPPLQCRLMATVIEQAGECAGLEVLSR